MSILPLGMHQLGATDIATSRSYPNLGSQERTRRTSYPFRSLQEQGLTTSSPRWSLAHSREMIAGSITSQSYHANTESRRYSQVGT